MTEVKLIPVLATPRGIVYAMVDDEDFNMLAGYAWSLRSNGKGTSFHIATSVAYRGIDGKRKEVAVLMHHAVIGLPPIGYDTNHINGDVFDNRKCNLEVIKAKDHSRISSLTRPRNENRGYIKGGS
jgi:hypothetical protein